MQLFLSAVFAAFHPPVLETQMLPVGFTFSCELNQYFTTVWVEKILTTCISRALNSKILTNPEHSFSKATNFANLGLHVTAWKEPL